MKSIRLILVFIFMLAFAGIAAFCGQTAGDKAYLQDPEALAKEIYKIVSMKAGENLPDWGKVRELFHEKAVVTLRTSRTGFGIFDTQGFIDDFIAFYKTFDTKTRGFRETVLKTRTVATGDIATVLIHYEAIVDGMKAPSQGLDSWHLLKKDGRWWIMSVINEVIGPNAPLPEILK